MADLRFLTTLVETQAKVAAAITTALVQQLTALWADFDGWYDGELVITQSRASASLVEAAQAQSRAQTVAYMENLYRDMELEFPDDVDLAMAEFDYPRHGIDIERNWERPARWYRYLRSTQESDEAARASVARRVEVMATDDLALARRDQENKVYRRTPKATGYRRIIHPDLSESGTCGLCVAAASRKYKVEELLPIHAGCKCTTAPITATNDPGLDLNEDDLKRLYESAGSTGRADLKAVRIKVVEHGELGPVLMKDGATEITEESPRITRAQRKAIRDAKDAPDVVPAAERISELERKIASAKKSIAWADTLGEDTSSRTSRAYWVVSTARNRISRYQREIDALSKREAA